MLSWSGAESNRRHLDFQSSALPKAELPDHHSLPLSIPHTLHYTSDNADHRVLRRYSGIVLLGPRLCLCSSDRLYLSSTAICFPCRLSQRRLYLFPLLHIEGIRCLPFFVVSSAPSQKYSTQRENLDSFLPRSPVMLPQSPFPTRCYQTRPPPQL